MKKLVITNSIFLVILVLLTSTISNAQTGLNFQGVARSSNNVIIASQQISLRLSILQGSAMGSVEYSETRKVTTNAQGLFAVVIGDADATSTMGSYNTINWKNTPKYLKIEMDATAGNNYTTMGTTQFQYVAYAQFASSVDAENIVGVVPVARGGTGATNLTTFKSSLALDKINNTTDADKPISTKTQTALDLKLNAADTSKYTKQSYTDAALLTKFNLVDTSKYTKQSYTDSSLITKLKLSDTAIMLSNRIGKDTLNLSSRINAKANLSDLTSGLALKADISDVATSLNSKLNKTDTSNLLQKADTATLSNRINLKANASDVNTSLGLKANASDVATSLTSKLNKIDTSYLLQKADTTTLSNRINLKANASDINTSLALKANTTEVNNSLLLKANASDVTTSLALKENISNKSSAADLGGTSPSDILYPTQKAVKEYVTANASGGGVADGGITTIKLADGAVTDAKLATGISKSKVGLGNVENISISSWAGTSSLTTVGTITSGTWSGTAISLNNGGTGATNAEAARANLGLVIGTNVQATLIAGTDYLTPTGSAAGLTNFPTLNQNTTGNAATAITAGNITATSNSTLTSLPSLTSVGTLANLTVTNPIAGSITGNAATAGNITATSNTTLTSVSNLNTVGTITSGIWSGTTIAVEKGGTGLTSAGTAGQVLTSTGRGTLVWQSTTPALSIGDVYQGGIVAYILQAGDPGFDATIQKGIIAASSDQSTGIRWYNGNNTTTGASGTAIGTGLSNTNAIIASQGATATSYAAGLARAYAGGGYTDWYLPSKDELNKLYLNRTAIGGFAIGFNYWSSTEGNANLVDVSSGAWCQSFYDGYQADGFKNYAFNVRAIRAFSAVKSIEEGGTGATTQQTAINAITGTQISGRYLRSDGTNATLSAIQIGDVPTLNQNTTGNALTATTASTVITNANLTGDVTSVGNATAIANNAVVTSKVLDANITYAKIQNVTTTDMVLGRVSSGSGVVEEIATTGTGNVVRATSPVLVTPNIGAATGSNLTTNSITNSGKIITGSSSAASTSAVFEANSTTQGLLLPRMTFAQRNAISSPVAGLVIYCTNCGTYGEMEVYDGSDWKNMLGKTRALVIGEPYQGGLLAYILQSGDPGYDVNIMHGLIVSTSDLGPIRWYNGSDLTTNASAVAIGTGLANTNTIITAQGAVTTSYAAGLARSHNGGGFTDWYLPSRDEMYKIYLNRNSIGGFANNYYWTSSENSTGVSASNAYVLDFYNGSQAMTTKNYALRIRPIRAF